MDRTPFYAEAGGQESDRGIIEIELTTTTAAATTTVAKFEVVDVQSYGGYVLHTGRVTSGSIPPPPALAAGGGGESSSAPSSTAATRALCRVDKDRRERIAPNHSMTHVLNAALRTVLGDTVEQRGSLCNEEKLRFDFANKKAVTTKQLREAERICADCVVRGDPVVYSILPLGEARELDGVRAVFGEVYPDPVRVVKVGEDTSVEFCGGTHVTNTAEAGSFVILEETAVAKGIRRITAVTGRAATDSIDVGGILERLVSEAEEEEKEGGEDKGKEKRSPGSLRKELDASSAPAVVKAELRSRIELLQKRVNEASKRALAARVDVVLNDVRAKIIDASESGDTSLILNVDVGADSKASQKVMNAARKLAPNMAFMGISEEEPGSGGKISCFAVVPVEDGDGGGLRADEWVRAALEVCGGRGGGQARRGPGSGPGVRRRGSGGGGRGGLCGREGGDPRRLRAMTTGRDNAAFGSERNGTERGTGNRVWMGLGDGGHIVVISPSIKCKKKRQHVFRPCRGGGWCASATLSLERDRERRASARALAINE